MPLWKIYHPVGCFTAEDKHQLSLRITALYKRLPRFYVSVVFQEVSTESFYVGGEPRDNFVRIWVDHIARTLPSAEARKWWIGQCDAAAGSARAGQRARLGVSHRRDVVRALVNPGNPPAPGRFARRKALDSGESAESAPGLNAAAEHPPPTLRVFVNYLVEQFAVSSKATLALQAGEWLRVGSASRDVAAVAVRAHVR